MEPRDKDGLTEAEFLQAYGKKNYPRPYLTADLVLLSESRGEVLLVKRGGHPFIGRWALPGGFSKADESVLDTALRELREETGITDLADGEVQEVGIFSRPGRDPRGWVVSAAYMAAVRQEDAAPKAGDDAAKAQWFTIGFEEDGSLFLKSGDIWLADSDLAFDHGEILKKALDKRLSRDPLIEGGINRIAD